MCFECKEEIDKVFGFVATHLNLTKKEKKMIETIVLCLYLSHIEVNKRNRNLLVDFIERYGGYIIRDAISCPFRCHECFSDAERVCNFCLCNMGSSPVYGYQRLALTKCLKRLSCIVKERSERECEKAFLFLEEHRSSLLGRPLGVSSSSARAIISRRARQVEL